MNYEDLFCERFFQFILPNLYSKAIRDHKCLYDYLLDISTIEQQLIDSGPTDYGPFIRASSVENSCPGYEELGLDLLSYFNKCTVVESNVLYFLWIINFFQPLISTFFTILFVLPLLLCLIVYMSSIYLLLTKHWKLFKVSACVFLAYLF